MSACLTQAELAALLGDGCSDAERKPWEAHVGACGECQQALLNLSADAETWNHWERLLQPGPTEAEPPTELLARIKTAAGLQRRPRTPPGGANAWPELPGYDIDGELGHGGMAVVYRARHRGLNRPVALKMILAGKHASPGLRARFRAEAEAVARLQHPHIVQIFDIGEHDGLAYFAMELIAGGSLAQPTRGQRWSFADAARLVETLARAIHHAHQQGIVHRDLKPANILLAGGTSPKIVDFGLALYLEDETERTRTGEVLGTPHYMAPEQAQGRRRDVGPGTDIHALGAILYELLVGRPPFDAVTPVETLVQVSYEEPLPPRRLRSTVPRDLETICLKCLRKLPQQRYASAQELADDLLRFRRGEPIHARPITVAERAVKWVRRRPLVAALLATLAVVLAGSMGLVTWKWRAEAQAADVARDEKQQADQARHEAENVSARALADLAITHGDHGSINRCLHLLAQALDLAVKGGDADLERAIRRNLTAWRPELVRRRAQFPHDNWVWAVAYSPDGKLCATGSRDKTARLWDTASGEPVGEPLRHEHPVWSLAFSLDGTRLLTGSGDGDAGDLRLWEVPSGKPLGPLRLPGGAAASGWQFVIKAALSADGRTLLAVTSGGAHVCRLSDDRVTACITLPHPKEAITAALSPDGKTVVTGGLDGTARLWEAETGKPIGAPLDHASPGGPPTGRESRVAAVAFSPDGALVLTGSQVIDTAKKRFAGGDARLWRTATGKLVGQPWPQAGPVKVVAFSPDGRRALTAGLVVDAAASGAQPNYRGEARLWEVATGKLIGPALQQDKPIWAAAFSPDGKVVLTGNEGGDVQFWRTATCQPIGAVRHNLGNVTAVAFSPDGRTALTGRTYEPSNATLWETPGGAGEVVPAVHEPGVQALAFTADGSRLVTAGPQGPARLWDVAAGRPLGELLPPQGRILAAAFNASADVLATAPEDGHLVQLWDVATRKPAGPSWRPPREVVSLAFAPDGRTLTANWPGYAALWDAATGAMRGEPIEHVGHVTATAFTPDGGSFLTGTSSGVARWWDAHTLRPLGASYRHDAAVLALAVSADGATLVLGSADHTASTWDLATGRPRTPPLQHEQRVRAVALSADAKTLVTGCTDRAARLWDLTTGLRLGPLLPHPGAVLVVSRPGNGTFATVADDGLLRFWELPAPAAGEPRELAEWVESLTGEELTDNGVLRELDKPALLRLRQRRLPR